MATKSVTIKAAWITFWGAIFTGIIVLAIQAILSNWNKKEELFIDISLYEQSQISEIDSLSPKSLKEYLKGIYDGSSLYDPKAILNYHSDRTGKAIRIRPEIEYLSTLNTGMIIEGINSLQCTYPVLSIKIVNNRSATVYFSEVVVEVISSEIIKEPVLRVSKNTENKLEITNEGWGKVIKPKIRFSITDSSSYNYISTLKEPLVYSIELQDFTASLEVDLSKFEPSPAITHSFPEYPINNQPPFEIPLYQIEEDKTVCTYGILDYRNENNELRSFKFKTLVVLSPFSMNIPLNPIYVSSFYALNLKAEIQNYKKHISISHAIESGHVDHFVILVASNMSAFYHLKFIFLTLGNKEFIANDVFLEFFVPRSNRDSFNDIKNLK